MKNYSLENRKISYKAKNKDLKQLNEYTRMVLHLSVIPFFIVCPAWARANR